MQVLGYVIGEKLYDGPRTVVFKARREQDQTRVILKVMKNEYPTASEIGRFRYQYELVERLELPGVIRPIAIEPAGNALALVMEDIDGRDLRLFNETYGDDVNLTLDIGIQVTEALGSLHRENIIHKDIKPENIIYNHQTRIARLIDFDNASQVKRENPEILNTRGLMGTLAYMSPEETGRMNRAIDYRTDFYSLGATLYHLLCNRPPFQSQDAMELIHAHLAKVPQSPLDVNSSIPLSFSQVIMKCLSKAPEDRYQSADGLIHDLRAIREGRANGSFELGQQDRRHQFRIPEKLFGRESEVDQLLAAFDRVRSGSVELVQVEGYSGIGKSTLVNEIHRPIVEARGYYVAGKFDQFKRDIPFLPLIHAIEELIAQVLTESESQIESVKQALIAALGDSSAVITSLVPRAALLLGEHPEPPELSPRETQFRFQFTFQRFFAAFASAKHPLTLFLDDLQWCDSGSIELIQSLLSDRTAGYILLIAAYRDNEVHQEHPWVKSVERLKTAEIRVSTIHVGPLKPETVRELVSEAFSTPASELDEIIRRVYEQAKGNPFFTNELLRTLYNDSVIALEPGTGKWQWDSTKLSLTAVSDDVVAFLIGKLARLPNEVQKALSRAACVGGVFDLATVSSTLNTSLVSAGRLLWRAVNEGLISTIGDAYKEILGEDTTDVSVGARAKYRFNHDRVQQASYELASASDRAVTHLQIARQLVQQTVEADIDEFVFDIVNQFQLAHQLLTDPAETLQVAKLTLKAGEKARHSTAYEASLTYYRFAEDLLQRKDVSASPEIVYAIRFGRAEAEFTTGHFDVAEELFLSLLKTTQDAYLRASIFEKRVQLYDATTRYGRAIEIGIEALAELGLKLTLSPGKIGILKEIIKAARLSKNKTLEDIEKLPTITDRKTIATLRLLYTVLPSAYQKSRELFALISLKMVNYSLKYGNSQYAPIAYGAYGIILVNVLKKYDRALTFSTLGIRLAENFGNPNVTAVAYFGLGCFVNHWSRPIAESRATLEKARNAALQGGNIHYLQLACNVESVQWTMGGINLAQVRDLFLSRMKLPIYRDLPTATLYAYMNISFAQAMLGETENPLSLDTSYITEEAIKQSPIWLTTDIGPNWFSLYKATIYYLHGQHQGAAEFMETWRRTLKATDGFYTQQYGHFLNALIALACKRDGIMSADAAGKVLKPSLKFLKETASSSPANCLAAANLIEAELLDGSTNFAEKLRKYDEAISLARLHQLTHIEAIAGELAGRFFLKMQNEKIARSYLRDARYAYTKWGANTKVAHMEEEYGSLAQAESTQYDSGTSTTHSIASATIIPATSHTLSATTSGSSSLSGGFDFASVLKSAQAISSEIVLDRLLDRVMQIAIENAGAQSGVLLLKVGDDWQVQATSSVDGTATSALLHAQLDEMTDRIATNVVNYVLRTGEAVVLGDAVGQGLFTKDAYIKQSGVLSLMCAPIVKQGSTFAIVYLENNLSRNAFTSDRVSVIQALCSQAAISIENAKLYHNLEESLDKQKKLTQAFERFVPKEFLRQLGKETIMDVALGDQVRRDMAVLFSDIRSFTTLSETMTPEENFNFLNAYLRRVSPMITSHNGFIDKYIGDAIMALFPNTADSAVEAAISMHASLDEYNVKRQKSSFRPISIGVGIHFGSLMLGTIGEANRMEGTVISDAVNLASRLEGLTKEFGSRIIISSNVKQFLHRPDMITTRPLGRIQVKGKAKHVDLLEVLNADPAEVRASKLKHIDAYTWAVARLDDGQFDTAVSAFKEVLAHSPDDRAAANLLKRAESGAMA